MSQESTKSNTLRFAEVRDRTGLSRATIYRRMRAGEFPAAIDLGNGLLGWDENEVEDWRASRPRRIPQGHGKPKDEPAPEAA